MPSRTAKKRRRASGIPPTRFTGEQTDLFQHSDEGFGCCAVSCPFGYCSTRYRNGASRLRDRPSDRCWSCRSTGVVPYDLVRGANGLSQLEHREPRQLLRNSFPQSNEQDYRSLIHREFGHSTPKIALCKSSPLLRRTSEKRLRSSNRTAAPPRAVRRR